MSWRIVMVQETGERVQYGRGSFQTSEAACDWIRRERLGEQHPECQFFVEPDILAPWALDGFWQ